MTGKSRFIDRLRHPVIREWLAILAVLWTLAFFAVRGEWFWRVDQTLYDAAIGLLQRPVQQDIVIVGVDEQSLKQIGRWPWKRSIHATFLNRLSGAGARVVVFDLILSEPDRQDPAGDRVLAEAIKSNGRVILPVTMDAVDGVVTGEAMPAPAFADGAVALSHISLVLDPDGVLRAVYLRNRIGAEQRDLSSLAALRLMDPDDWGSNAALPGEADPHPLRTPQAGVRNHWYHIPFAGPPGHFPIIAYVDVLRGDVPDAAFRDKTVLVGVTAPGLRDEFPTPVSGDTRAMSGIEVQANVLQGLREHLDIRLASSATSIMLVFTLVAVLMGAYLWLTPRQALGLTAIFCVAALAGSALLFRFQSIWLSPAVPFLGLLLAYPLWSWRKLEATQRYFDAELNRLESEPSIVPDDIAKALAPRSATNAFVPDVIENRIAAVQATTQRLRNLNRFVANSLEGLPAAALVTDAAGRILLANSFADRIFKSRRRKADRPVDLPVEGRDLFDLMRVFHHEGAHGWQHIWEDAQAKAGTVSIDANGPDEREYLVQIAPAYSTRGTLTGSIVTLTDISALRESERRRDEALRFLSHDMRSPQASIITLLDMYQDDPAGMPVSRLTDRIGKYARRTLNLADDFLRLAKAERVTSKDFEPVDLGELLRDAAEEAWSNANAKKIVIVVDASPDESWVSGDRDLLTRTLVNLLSNAVKYSPPETSIRCSLARDGQSWRVRIADQGYGISAADLPKLFTRFTRLKHDAQPEEEGIGLGLVFVKTVVERHGGTVEVQSKVAAAADDEHGTVFTLTLAAVEAPA